MSAPLRGSLRDRPQGRESNLRSCPDHLKLLVVVNGVRILRFLILAIARIKPYLVREAEF